MAKRLYKVENDKKLLGVCGGLAEYFNTDPTIVRVAWAIFTVLSFGTAILIYILCALIFPSKSEVEPSENKSEEQQ
ncbi:PspC domain-containing protein [bacterium]|nr:PspC domain-containing protein [bacterium]